MNTINHNSGTPATTSAENILLHLMKQDCVVLSKRADAEAAEKKEDMRANSRAAALQRAAAERQSKIQPVVSPTKRRRATA